MNRRRFIIALGASSLAAGCAGGGTAHPRAAQSVLFMCEHGYAKSLVAALHFQRMAKARGLNLCALSRGVDPGAAVPPAIREGLAADGFAIEGFRPARATEAELARVTHVVLFAVSPDLGAHNARVLHWDDISPLTVDYRRARNEIVANCAALLDSLQSAAGE